MKLKVYWVALYPARNIAAGVLPKESSQFAREEAHVRN